MTRPAVPSAADADLLAELGELARTVDPPPGLVAELGRAAFGLRRLDAELASLVEDSAQQLAGVRGAGEQTRLLTFSTGPVELDVQVSPAGDGYLLVGQVASPSPRGGRVRLQVLDRPDLPEVELDSSGCFRVDDAPAATVRLHVEVDGHRPVVTEWTRL